MMELARLLTKLSIDDLKSSRILYESRQYRTSYFFFQQSAEKANKALGLFLGIITEKDLFDIQHKQTKIYRKGLVTQEGKANTFTDLIGLFPQVGNHDFVNQINVNEYKKYLQDGLRYIDSLYNLDLVHIPSPDLSYMLRELRKLEKAKTVIKLPKKANQEMKGQLIQLADWIGTFGTTEATQGKKQLEEMLNDDSKFSEFAKDIHELMRVYVDSAFIGMTFWFCAIVTVQHSSLTRYPDSNRNNPMDIYKKRLPLVKKQPEFMDLLWKALVKLQRLLPK